MKAVKDVQSEVLKLKEEWFSMTLTAPLEQMRPFLGWTMPTTKLVSVLSVLLGFHVLAHVH